MPAADSCELAGLAASFINIITDLAIEDLDRERPSGEIEVDYSPDNNYTNLTTHLAIINSKSLDLGKTMGLEQVTSHH